MIFLFFSSRGSRFVIIIFIKFSCPMRGHVLIFRGQLPCLQVESTKTKIDIRCNQSANQESPLRPHSESSGGHYGHRRCSFVRRKQVLRKQIARHENEGREIERITGGESRRRRQMTERGMQRGSSSVSFRTRGPAALVLITIISLLFFNVIAETSNNSQV